MVLLQEGKNSHESYVHPVESVLDVPSEMVSCLRTLMNKILTLATFETGSNAPIGHVRIYQKPLCCCHTESNEPEQIPMNC